MRRLPTPLAEAKVAAKELELAGQAQNMVMVPRGEAVPFLLADPESLQQPAITGTPASRRFLIGCVTAYLKEKEDHRRPKTYAKYRRNWNCCRVLDCQTG
jgi:hypothetical protein